MRTRSFRYMYDDTMRCLSDLELRSGELAGRKPLIISFLGQEPKRRNGTQAASVRMGKALIGKLERLGIK